MVASRSQASTERTTGREDRGTLGTGQGVRASDLAENLYDLFIATAKRKVGVKRARALSSVAGEIVRTKRLELEYGDVVVANGMPADVAEILEEADAQQ